MHPSSLPPDPGPRAPYAPAAAPEGPAPHGAGLPPARRRIVSVLAALAVLVAPAIAGYEVGRDDGASAPAAAPISLPDGTRPLSPTGGSSGSSAAPRSSVDLSAVADAVDDSVVNINTRVEGGGEAAGTGIVISRSGLVLTNNHVIAGTTGLTVEFGATGTTRPAKVLGYSVVDDVALIQVENVSGVTPAALGESSSLRVGQTVLALGNAGGRGGSPTIVTGAVTALEQEITASEADGSDVQTLDGLIQLAAGIQSGDSGGPVVDSDGKVVGMTVAASVSNGFGFPGRGGDQGYAIPIEDAMAVAKKIVSGEGGPDIRVGATRAVLGVQVQPQLTNQRVPGGTGAGGGDGARVVGVESGSGADRAGLEEGDVIVALDGRTIATSRELIAALVPYDPGDSVPVTWRDAGGSVRRGTVVLGEGPPA